VRCTCPALLRPLQRLSQFYKHLQSPGSVGEALRGAGGTPGSARAREFPADMPAQQGGLAGNCGMREGLRFPRVRETIVLPDMNLRFRPARQVALVGETAQGDHCGPAGGRLYDPGEGSVLPLDCTGLRDLEPETAAIRGGAGHPGELPVPAAIGEQHRAGKPGASGGDRRRARPSAPTPHQRPCPAARLRGSASGGGRRRGASPASSRSPGCSWPHRRASAHEAPSLPTCPGRGPCRERCATAPGRAPTALIIAHRLSTVRCADRGGGGVLVMSGGETSRTGRRIC